MNLLDQAKHIPHGVAVISKWLGSGGEVVDQEIAQARADVCNRCHNNVLGFKPIQTVATAVKQYLSVKNGLGLRVNGEHSLGACSACWCQLRLLVWEPQEKVQRELTDEERPKLPIWCWRLGLEKELDQYEYYEPTTQSEQE